MLRQTDQVLAVGAIAMHQHDQMGCGAAGRAIWWVRKVPYTCLCVRVGLFTQRCPAWPEDTEIQ